MRYEYRITVLSICCGWDWDGVRIVPPEKCPVHDDGNCIKDDRADEGRAKSVADLQPAADGGTECPAKIPRHADEAGNGGACGGFDAFHHEGLIDRRTHVHQRQADVIRGRADPEDGRESEQDQEGNG